MRLGAVVGGRGCSAHSCDRGAGKFDGVPEIATLRVATRLEVVQLAVVLPRVGKLGRQLRIGDGFGVGFFALLWLVWRLQWRPRAASTPVTTYRPRPSPVSAPATAWRNVAFFKGQLAQRPAISADIVDGGVGGQQIAEGGRTTRLTVLFPEGHRNMSSDNPHLH